MSLRRIADGISSWIEIVAEVIVASISWLRAGRRVQLVEGEGDTFSIQIGTKSGLAVPPFRLLSGGPPNALPADLTATLRGTAVEVGLRPDQSRFRPRELPKRATEFLDGIIRAQIDRLTPWSAGDALFGWTQPAEAPNDRISLMVVATARARIAPYLHALTGLGANAIVVSARPQDGP